MDKLINFVLINRKRDIVDLNEYVNEIFENLQSTNVIKCYNISQPEIADEFYMVSIELQSVFIIDIGISEENFEQFQVVFSFETFNNVNQLNVEINSINYRLKVDDCTLEYFKLSLKNLMRNEWQDIIWLLDKDSELLSIELYPYI